MSTKLLVSAILILGFFPQKTLAAFFGTKASVSMACPAHITNDTKLYFTVTNNSTKPLLDHTEIPIVVKVKVTVKDGANKLVARREKFPPILHMWPPTVIAPGSSYTLKDRYRGDHTGFDTPTLRDFGYELAPGTYQISASVTDATDEPQSNVCNVTMP